MELLDLIQEGTIGLVRGVENLIQLEAINFQHMHTGGSDKVLLEQ